MSNPSKSFLHSDDQQAGQVQKVKKVRQVQVLGISHNTTVRCGRGVAAWYDVMGMSRGGVARVGGRGVLSIGWWLCALGWGAWLWVGGCGVLQVVLWRHAGGLAVAVSLVVAAMAGLVHGEVAMVSGEKDSLKAELVVVLRVATAWWGVIWSLRGGVVVVENLCGSNKRRRAG
ncbi:hypothetical protein EDB89DRAFT_1916417 [Lactarius sanguifluus]|nr:hypothetical protein EDB89DRAFT_1916417 [Lactarius sanguifluus]